MSTDERIEVRRWVQEAIDLYEGVGKEKALAEIADPDGRLIQGERYIFALDLDGNLLAHPFAERLRGKNLIGLRDCDGRNFISKMVDVAKARGYGFTEYKWPAPGAGKEFHKVVFFERVDGMILCGGFYTIEEGALESLFRCFQYYGPCW